ncbi:MAG: hypothetical protein HYY93_10480 [Planctomycetes bacterium]|nr:hypothetical protein [Planctomycetota bacterium]
MGQNPGDHAASTTARPPGRRRWRRLGFALLALVLLIVAAGFGLVGSVNAGWWTPRIEAWLLQKTGQQVRIGDLKWRPLESLTVSEISLPGAAGPSRAVAVVRSLKVEYDGLSILEGQVRSITVAAVEADLSRATMDALRRARPVPAASDGPPLAWSVETVSVGRLEVDWTEGEKRLHLGQGEITLTGLTAQGISQIQMRTELPGECGRLTLGGTATIASAPGAKGTVRIEGLDLSGLNEVLPAGTIPPEVSCDGVVSLSGDLVWDGARTTFSGRVDGVDLSGRLAGGPSVAGEIRVDLNLSLEGPRWDSRWEIRAARLSASTESWSVPPIGATASGTASGDGPHGRWEIPDVELTHPAWKLLRGSGMGTLGPNDWTSIRLTGEAVDVKTVSGWGLKDLKGSPTGFVDVTLEAGHSGDEIAVTSEFSGRDLRWSGTEGQTRTIPDVKGGVGGLWRSTPREGAFQARLDLAGGSDTVGPVTIRREGGPTTGAFAGVVQWPDAGARGGMAAALSVPALTVESTDGAWSVLLGHGELGGEARFDLATGEFRVDGGALKTTPANMTFSGGGGGTGQPMAFSAAARDLSVESLRAAFRRGLPEAWADWGVEGRVALDLRLSRPGGGDDPPWSLHAGAALSDAGIASPDFSIEVRRVASSVTVDASLPALPSSPVEAAVTGAVTEGSISAGRIYHSLASPGIEFASRLTWDAADPKARRMAWAEGRLAWPAFATLEGLAGSCSPDAEGAPVEASGRLSDLDLGAAYRAFVQEPFSGNKEFLKSLDVTGHAGGDFRATRRGGGWTLDGHASLRDAGIGFGALRIEGVSLRDLPFALRSPEGVSPVAPDAVPSEARGTLRIGRILDGPVDLRDQAWTISLHENAFTLHDALEWPDLLGGTVALGGLSARGLLGDSPMVETSLSCRDLSIPAVSELAGWKHVPPGTVSLHYPRIVFAGDRLQFDGEAVAHLWNGEVRVEDFLVSDCFSDGRSVHFAAVLEHLDLELIARTFSEIGEVHGVIDGRLDGFEFSAGEPWRFDLYVHGLPEEKGPKWMSAKAVESATAVTAGGFQGIGEQILKSKEWPYRYLGAYMRMGPGEDGLLRVLMRGAYRKRSGGLLPIPKFEAIPLEDLRANRVVEEDEEYFLVGPLLGGINIRNSTPGGTVRRDKFLDRIRQVMSAKVEVKMGTE